MTQALGDIAVRADVSRSTLHRHFPDRQSLVTRAQSEGTIADDLETRWLVGAHRLFAAAPPPGGRR
ncbi:hypothetical protein GTC6_10566 [Gordonia terrae C-6]|uniref:HTH tetR-type domain-containing protein n=1 Tax=Gordonia terrae C-6 TaxID=1316928 RepID=R7Y9U0_9ACTN|nr:TetR family transcriptional regulator [Gordonia terrae]EON32796.1 hypothetical protein GTC6_10566 [Gordonia terrae C-6]